MRIQGTSVSLEASLRQGLKKYAHALILKGKQLKTKPKLFLAAVDDVLGEKVEQDKEGKNCVKMKRNLSSIDFES